MRSRMENYETLLQETDDEEERNLRQYEWGPEAWACRCCGERDIRFQVPYNPGYCEVCSQA